VRFKVPLASAVAATTIAGSVAVQAGSIRAAAGRSAICLRDVTRPGSIKQFALPDPSRSQGNIIASMQ